MRKIVIAGGSGMIGTRLTKELTKLGYQVCVLSRRGEAPSGAIGVAWDGIHLGPWVDELEDANAVVNLSGTSIAKKWTPEYKSEILTSRVQPTQAIGKALESMSGGPTVWINGSAGGIYGNRGDAELTEKSDIGPRGNFLVDTCVAWEAIVEEYDLPGIRRVRLRTGIVLDANGGFFPPMHTLARWFLGGHHGSGDQFISWIHVTDMTRVIIHCIENEGIHGAVNATAPEPVSNRFFMAALRAVLGRPWSPPAPAFMLKLANYFGAPDPSLLLEGQRILPAKLVDNGFTHKYPAIREAFVDLVKPQPPK